MSGPDDPEDDDAPIGAAIAGAALYGALAAANETRRGIEEGRAGRRGVRRAFARRGLRKEGPASDAETDAGIIHSHADRPGEHPPLAPQRPVHESRRLARARGRYANSPWRLPPRAWRHILHRTWIEMNQDHLGLIAAGVAFYAILALFPSLSLLVALGGLFAEPVDVASALDAVSEIFPREAAQILLNQTNQVANASGSGLGLTAIFSFAIALYSASRGVMSLIEGLNVAYDEDEKRSFLRLGLTAFVLTLVVIGGTFVGLTATVVIPAVLEIFGIEAGLLTWFDSLRWPILLIGTIIGLTILYRFGPSREHARWSWLSPGALLACLLWLIGTAGFAWYAGNFALYNQTFGTLGGAIVLLIWLWLSAYVVLIGAELNGEIEAQIARDTTTGPALPRGRRGAVKADTLGEPVD
ncbi:YihY/virulence factor BrkB family protein [Frigidibacter sp. ROC022]|uniref:YihY/virulence factor BrkB family protein n=1 Tax=Frigidibacter sp. ROC022 TaxID=2971796 RepID=UPI00215B4D44|nr:YihY/virulence factor BrkB family protein [Frigidibacter sp. ROC022]MCR8723688.1 YihY/virulence factor BrkB family protein [Frigidibacter sp. ROC022]